MAGKFELFKDRAGEFRFRLKAANGEIILASEGYRRRASAMNGIRSVKGNATVASRFATGQTRSGQPMFNLRAANGRLIGTSEAYSSVAACENGVAAVMKAAPGARVDDLTEGGLGRLPARTIETVSEIAERRRDVLERLAKL